MKPSTPHYVLTLENSITYGRHFYSSADLEYSVYGVIHSFVAHAGVTNTLHDNVTRTFLHRIMAMIHQHYVVDQAESKLICWHGVWNILMVNNDRLPWRSCSGHLDSLRIA